MAQRLYAIMNATGNDAIYSSSEYPRDRCELPKSVVTHTGGKDDDYVLIADCSAVRYYDDHHCTIEAKDRAWTVTIWNNDEEDHLLYWSVDGYAARREIVNSQNWPDVTLVVSTGPAGPVISCSEWSS
jgi:hypothetical protein